LAICSGTVNAPNASGVKLPSFVTAPLGEVICKSNEAELPRPMVPSFSKYETPRNLADSPGW